MQWLNRKLSRVLLWLASKALRLAAWFEERGGPLPKQKALDDLDRPGERQLVTGITAIGEDMAQSRGREADQGQ
jgi:hypothetical protein